MKKTAFALLICILALMIVPCKASPFSVLAIVPEGEIPDSDPVEIDYTGPVTFDIWFTGTAHEVTNIWLVLALNNETYNNLGSITADGVTFLKTDFEEVLAARIPPEAPDILIGYPGCTFDDQFPVGPIKEKLGEPCYYGYKPFGSSFDLDTSGRENGKQFILTINLLGEVEDLGVLVLGNGVDTTANGAPKFNVRSAWSKSTFVVPEPGTIAAVATSLVALMAYTARRRKR